MLQIPEDTAELFYDDIVSVIESKNELISNLISLRSVFHKLFVELTENEEISFSSMQSRIDYVIMNNNIEDSVTDKIRRIKSFYYKTINKKVLFSENDYSALLSELITLIYDLTGSIIPEELQKIADKHKPEIKQHETEDPVSFIKSVKCVVLNKTDISKNENEKEYFSIFCEGTDEDLRFSLRIYSFNFEDFRILHRNLRKYQTIRILNIKASVKEKYFYTPTKDTLIISEPDFLIEASEIAECFSGFDANPNIYFVRKLIPGIPGAGAFKGTLVNGLMDKLICDSNINPKEILNKLMKEYPLRACAIGEDGINKIINEILSIHYTNLLRLFKDRVTNKIKIEPTFISPVYGISGRLDALIIPEGNPDNKNVFELKSGKPPKSKSIWQNNKMQLVCYNLLMKSTYGSERKGTNSILYSASRENAFRAVSISLNDEKKALSVRNQIVSDIFRLSENKYDILNKFLTSAAGPVPVFSNNDVIEFSNLLNEASETEAKYYRYNLSFAIREYINSKTGNSKFSEYGKNGFSSLWNETIEEKGKNYNIINNLILKEFRQEDDTLEFCLKGLSDHNFRDNDFVIIYKTENEETDPLKTELFRGKIKTINTHKIEVVLHNKQLDISYYSEGSIWIIEHDIVESNVWTTIQSLYDFLRAPKAKKELILGIREPQYEEKDYEYINNLSSDQNENIRKAINAKDYFLLQGPPGSGKTSTSLTGIIEKLININKREDKKILVLAYTNRAVDEICSKLNENKIEFIKIGGKSNDENFEISTIFSNNNLKEFEKIIQSKDVFISTVSSFYTKLYDLKEICDIDTVIIDEASQLTDYSIAGILCNFKKFIMIGDQNQLPPVITQDSDSCRITDTDLNNINIKNLNLSLFERLFLRCKNKGWDEAYGMLRTHYRLHNDISSLINKLYDDKLIAGKSEQTIEFNIFRKESENKTEELLSRSRLIFIDSEYERISKANYSEAIIVNKILKTIKNVFGTEFNEKTVGVVTPWRAQIALIRKHIDDADIWDKVSIDTVERFQGSEREIIINSYAIHTPRQLKNLESINAEGIDRKLLVSISRGSKQFIITGNRKVLEKGYHYKEIIEHIKKFGVIVSQKERKSVFGV